MADELDALLPRVADEGLRSELRHHIERLRRKRQFGLVFESHLPERVRLPDHPIRRGLQVVRRDASPRTTPQIVLQISGRKAVLEAEHDTVEELLLEDLVVVAEFGDVIYPGLQRLGAINRGGDERAHAFIKGENYHVLEALRFSHAARVDCIYIDPPYNTGARDWKYDNDYVDADDSYRHSKWLAFMERRLRLARELLNPEDSILIVAIDEKEYLRLGLLLEQVFPDAEIQMVTVVTNHAGSTRRGRFSRVDEYLFYVFLGRAQCCSWISSMLGDPPVEAKMPGVWFPAVRSGAGSALRQARPNLFYPVFIDANSGGLHAVGDAIGADEDRENIACPPGTVALWPLSSNGREQTWRFSADRMRTLLFEGKARLGERDNDTGMRPISYLQPGTLEKIENGTYVVVGRSEEGALLLDLADETFQVKAPASVWHMRSHFAREYGTKLNGQLIPGRVFPYPKSLYAVEDSLRVAIGDKPEAVVLDFFAGSGTTAHAVFRLNKQDGGRRQSISVTNNEVSADDAAQLRAQGLRPGDPAWEAEGIFEHICRPRVEVAVTGVKLDGLPIANSYKFTDEFPMDDGFEENIEFFGLKYLDLDDIELDLAFESVAPLLWLRAGGAGMLIDHRCDDHGTSKPYAITDHYGILFEPDSWRTFVEALPACASTVFVVTDSQSAFASIANELPSGLDVVRLYENYLSTFAIGGAR